MAIDSNDHPAGSEPQHDAQAQWVPGPLERPILGDDDGWSDARPDDEEDDRRDPAEDNEQDQRRRIIRLGGNGF